MPNIPPNNRNLGRFVAMSQVGIEMIVPLGIGLVLDSYFNIKPWGVIIGMVCGFVGGLAHLIILAHPKGDEPDQQEDDKP